MRETLLGDIAFLWGSTWPQHALFVAGVVAAIGALAKGWIEADNAIRWNRRFRNDESKPT
jgi:hypothetical protein